MSATISALKWCSIHLKYHLFMGAHVLFILPCIYLRLLVPIQFYFRWCSCSLTVTRRESHVEQELLTLLEHLRWPPLFRWVHVRRSLFTCVMFCWLLFALLSFFFWPLYYLSFELQLLITPSMSSNFSFTLQNPTVGPLDIESYSFLNNDVQGEITIHKVNISHTNVPRYTMGTMHHDHDS